MGINSIFELLGGLALFLFGMNTMSHALERFAGSQMKPVFSKLTSNKFKSFMLGLVVTAIIQSSSAPTIMVVGFVNSGLMTLGQSIGIIMGANVGAAVTGSVSCAMAIPILMGQNLNQYQLPVLPDEAEARDGATVH